MTGTARRTRRTPSPTARSRTGNILITVTPANDAPIANNDTATVDEDTATDVTAQLLANDTDPDGDTLVVSGVSNDAGGTVEFDAGTVTFTPAADDCGDGVGSFDYDISDGNGGSDSASVTVDVTCLNDAPEAVDDTASGTEDMPVDDRSGRPARRRHRHRRRQPVGQRRLEAPAAARSPSLVEAITFTPDCRSVRGRRLRLRHQRRQRRHRQRSRGGRSRLRQRRTGGRRRLHLGHRGHAGDDRSGRPAGQRLRHRWRHADGLRRLERHRRQRHPRRRAPSPSRPTPTCAAPAPAPSTTTSATATAAPTARA